MRHQAQVADQGKVFLGRAAGEGQVVADDAGIGPGHEHQALELAQVFFAAAGHLDDAVGHDQPEHRDNREDLQRRHRRRAGQRRAGDRMQEIQRDDVRAQVADRKGEVHAVLVRLAHAHEAARAEFQAGVEGRPGRPHAVLKRVGGADGREEPGRGLQVVVVADEAGVDHAAGPLRRDRAETAAHAQAGPAADVLAHVEARLELGLREAGAAGDQAEVPRTSGRRRLGHPQQFVGGRKTAGLQACLPAGALAHQRQSSPQRPTLTAAMLHR